jgi:hypothetical protein
VFDALGVAGCVVAVSCVAVSCVADSGVVGLEQLAVLSAVRAVTVATHRRTVSLRIRKRDVRLDATLSPGVSQLLSGGSARWMMALPLPSSL